MLSFPTSVDPHIRPIHLRYDLIQIADLVELCFADHMDMEGRAYLQNIRQIGRQGNPFYLDAASPETSPVPFQGFVWIENNKIIGNITLIYLKKKGQNVYFIANVAVEPSHRGQGIARKLTECALRHAREHNGKLAMLQVRDDNPIAIHIYESLGFYEMTRRTNWTFDKSSNNPPDGLRNIKVKPRNNTNWLQQKKWLEEIYPEKVTWFLPYTASKYEPGILRSFSRWFDLNPIHFWEVVDNGRLLGLAILEGINQMQDYLWLATSPAYEEQAVYSLASHINRHSINPSKIQINYPAYRAISAFQAAGMKELNTLIWMENRLSIVQELTD